MKYFFGLAVMVSAILIVSVGCDPDSDGAGSDSDTDTDTDGDGTGTLTVTMAIGDYDSNTGLPRAVHTLDIISVRHTLYSLKCTTEEIVDGEADDLTWETIYENTEEQYDYDLEISADLPPGEYTGLRIDQSNQLFWVCTNGKATYEFPDMNNAKAQKDDHILNVFGPDAMYVYDSEGAFSLATSKERMGTSFTIVEGATTHLTVRTNFDTLDWNDADNNLKWTEGVDSLDNWTTIPGTDTMADFFVE